MTQEESTEMRLNFTFLMRKKNYSAYTSFSIVIHIANLEERETGDKIVQELMSLVEGGMPEQEFRKLAQEKYGIPMLG